ncbi:putative two-component response regulator ARR13 [Acorus calamus]|uniref:Two-component response regulator ARR13 n=1 Tax=Acorus calamus TaxID=4465 RepID=A0AAV9ERB4_ACOCL|nr:putative two-component response regulator ARR13 [Acorus calamus]
MENSHSVTTRVLVIDSDRDVANKLLTTCSKAEYALKLLQDMDVKFDIVMIDAFMSDMDSFELLERISNDVNVSIIRTCPKEILARMNVPYLTRENVASHLQRPSENNQVFNVSQISGPSKDGNNTTQCVEDKLSPIFTMDMLESLFRKMRF